MDSNGIGEEFDEEENSERNSIRVMKPLASKTLFGFGQSAHENLDIKMLSAPSNLWTEEHLEELYGKEFLEKNFDF